MKKMWDKLKKYIKNNQKVVIFFTVLFIIAIISGSIFSITLKNSDNELVSNYLKNYLNEINNNSINYFDSFVNTLLSETIVLILIWFFGLSVIGIPIIFIVFFYKAFVFGFTVGSIILNYKLKGILIGTLYMIPHNAIKIILMMLLSIYAFNISHTIFKSFLYKKEFNFKSITTKYIYVFIIIVFINSFISLYSSFTVPKMIKLILPIIN